MHSLPPGKSRQNWKQVTAHAQWSVKRDLWNACALIWSFSLVSLLLSFVAHTQCEMVPPHPGSLPYQLIVRTGLPHPGCSFLGLSFQVVPGCVGLTMKTDRYGDLLIQHITITVTTKTQATCSRTSIDIFCGWYLVSWEDHSCSDDEVHTLPPAVKKQETPHSWHWHSFSLS